jgi:hypothetical protein
MNPDDLVREHGADALRLYEMFMGAARLAGQAVRKFVYVPGQVVNLVVG